MWRLWKIIDPRTVILMLVFFLAGMAFLLHFIVYNADRFTWLYDVVSPDYPSTARVTGAAPAQD